MIYVQNRIGAAASCLLSLPGFVPPPGLPPISGEKSALLEFALPYTGIEKAAEIIRNGGVVAFPTETVYGLGASALNEKAVARIFTIKGRPSHNPIISHLAHMEAVFRYGEKSELALRLARYWPGPLTLVLPHHDSIPSIVTAGSRLAGFRIPDHPVALELLRLVDLPVAAPSANLSNTRSPTDVSMVQRQLGDLVDGILDGGRCRSGIESTVIRPEGDRIRILREGGITREQLLADGFLLAEDEPSAANSGTLDSPGLLKLHYAPSIPLVYLDCERFDRLTRSTDAGKIAVVSPEDGSILSRPPDFAFSSRALRMTTLTFSDARDAAYRLYHIFDSLDPGSLDLVLVSPLPEPNLGRAVNDRLLKAAHFIGCIRDNRLLLLPK